MDDLTPEDCAALELAKGGVECEHGTDAGKRYERLCELGYVKEALFTPNGIAWKLTRKGAGIAYADPADKALQLSDAELLAAYQRTDGEPGNAEADALAAEIERRELDV